MTHHKVKQFLAMTTLSSVFFAAKGTALAGTAPDNFVNMPLTLKSRGSFYIGGEKANQSFTELGSRRTEDVVTVNQMYVEFMIPVGEVKLSLILIHGAGTSGASFDTTPDGRIGWFEYFVRKSHPTYVVDQVGRARSGFNQAVFNNVGAGAITPAKQPQIVRLGDNVGAWLNFRIGPTPGVPFSDSQFPVSAVDALSQQGIPDIADPDAPKRTVELLGRLTRQLGGAVLISHSQSGPFPMETVLRHSDSLVKAIVVIEPGTCNNAKYSDADVRQLARVPLLIVFGDHLSAPTGLPGPGWQDRFNECQQLAARIGKFQGHAEVLHTPKLGISGNSHMMMQDKNNLRIADLILTWIDRKAASASQEHE